MVEVSINKVGDKYQVVDSAGNVYETSDIDDAKNVLSVGGRPATRDEIAANEEQKKYSSFKEQAKGFGQQFASVASFGTYDAAGAGLGGQEWIDARKKRAEYATPLVSVGGSDFTAQDAGTAAGILLPSLLTGGLGAGANVGRLGGLARTALVPGAAVEARIAQAARTLGVGESALARTAGMAASGAVEGGLYAAGRELSDASLSNTDLTAERLLSAFGHGATYGGLAGGGLGLGSAALGKLGTTIANKVRAGEKLDDLTAVATRDKLNKVVNNQEKIINELGLTPGRTGRFAKKMDSAISEAEALAVQAGRKSDDALKEIVAAKRTTALAEQKALVSKLDEVGAKVETGPAFERLRAQAQKLKSEPILAYSNLGQSLEKDIVKAEQVPQTFSSFYKLQQKLDAKVDNAVKKQLINKADADDIKNAFTNSLDESLNKSDDIFGKLAADGDDFAKQILAQQGSAKQAFKNSKEDYLDYKLLEQNLKETAKEEQVSLINKIRELAKDRASDAAWGAGIGVATGQDPQSALLGGVAGAVGPRALLNVARQKAMRYAADHGSAGLGAIGQKISQQNRAIDNAARGLVYGTKRAVPVGVVAASLPDQEKQFARLQTQLQDLGDENRKAEFLTKATRGLENHPDLQQAVQHQILQDYHYIRSKMPNGFAPVDAFSFDVKPKYTKEQIRKINNIVAALYKPETVIDDLNNGQIDLDAITALKERRPSIYSDIRSAIIRHAVKNPESISYKRKLLIGTAFDFKNIEWSMQNGAELQSLGEATGEEPEEKGPGRPRSVKLNPEIADQTALKHGLGSI